jgi:hypothetical protein
MTWTGDATAADAAKARLAEMLAATEAESSPADGDALVTQTQRLLPIEEDETARLKLCEEVESWSADLFAALHDTLAWKDSVVAMDSLPSNVLARLCVLASKLTRGKSKLRSGLLKVIELTRGLSKGILLNEEVQRHRYVAD